MKGGDFVQPDFKALVIRAYREAKCAYSLDEVLSVLEYFLDKYKQKTGENHPFLRRKQLKDIIEKLPFVDRDQSGVEDSSAEDYPAIIEAYFATNYGPACDYRLNHFFSGAVREIKFYECFY